MNVFFSRNKPTNPNEGIYLLPDSWGTKYSSPWDDFGYKLSFKVYNCQINKWDYFGLIRILIKNHNITAEYFENEGKHIVNDIYSVGDLLTPDKAVSLPYETDYYKIIGHVYENNNPDSSNERIEEFLETICDASYHYGFVNEYRSWDGFSSAIMRDGSKAEAMIKKGMNIALGLYTSETDISFRYSDDNIDSIDFNYNLKDDISHQNINLLVGKNGTGKSHVLSEISKITLGLKPSPPLWPFFHKLIVIAYSPFESFHTKDTVIALLESRDQSKRSRFSIKRKRVKVNEYSYIGFKSDDNGLFDINTPRIKTIESIIKILTYDNENSWWREKGRLDILTETLLTCIDFDSMAIFNRNNQDEPSHIIDDTLFKSIGKIDTINSDIKFMKDGKELPLSSGQKIYSYMIPAIVSEIEDESLLLIDEPELYLHPNLEIELLCMLKRLLGETNSIAIIATHSAVISREIKSKSIHILHRTGMSVSALKPGIETYGESLERIISEIFEDKLVSKGYETDLDSLIGKYGNIETLITEKHNEVGDDALIYLLSKSSNDSDISIEANQE